MASSASCCVTVVAPFTGAGIETGFAGVEGNYPIVAPFTGAVIVTFYSSALSRELKSRPLHGGGD